jgi:hypothetical protein
MKFEAFVPTEFDEIQKPGVAARPGHRLVNFRFDTFKDAELAARALTLAYAMGYSRGKKDLRESLNALLTGN